MLYILLIVIASSHTYVLLDMVDFDQFTYFLIFTS